MIGSFEQPTRFRFWRQERNMSTEEQPLAFQQIHIEVARNATDDFNPFHDKNKWHQIDGNPFGGTIALGFQMACLIEYRVRLHREAAGEYPLLEQHGLKFSNYQFNFVNAVKCGQEIAVEIKPSQLREGDNTTLSNRVTLRAAGDLALLGFKRESRQPLVLPEFDPERFGDLEQHEGNAYLPDEIWFLTRKYITNSNAKNFMSGALVEQADYIDELEDRVSFPDMYPCALASCALLQQGVRDGLDFKANPMVYTSHKFTVDRDLMAALHSNDLLHLLTRRLPPSGEEENYECHGVLRNGELLFRSLISLVPLASIKN
jgi:hypothetical protein